MVQQGYKVKFITSSALAEELLLAKEENRLQSMDKQWLKYDVVICDELGYVPFSKMGGELLFQFFPSVMSGEVRSSPATLILVNG